MSLVLTSSPPDMGLFPPEVGRLHIDGTTFRTEAHDKWQWRGISYFLGPLRLARGEDIRPDLRWMREMGFNIPRSFGALPWVETPDYRVQNFPYGALDDYFGLLEEFGLRCNFSIGHYRHPDFFAYSQRVRQIAERYPHVLLERVNEPHVGSEKPDPIEDFDVAKGSCLTSYGLYGQYYDKVDGLDPTLDFGTVHIQRDSAWHRKARHAQELQHATGKPWISDEPAKLTEPGFSYPGGKNDPLKTPQEIVWHAAVCCLYTPGFTFHCEDGKWGHVPAPGSLQRLCAEAVRDAVFKKIDAYWQDGVYKGAHSSGSPVDGKGLQIDGQDIWTYSTVHPNAALSVRCAVSAPQPRDGWRVVDRWGPGGSIVRLER